MIYRSLCCCFAKAARSSDTTKRNSLNKVVGSPPAVVLNPIVDMTQKPGYKWSKWDELGATSLKTALLDTTMIDAAWLADLADSGGVLPRCQDVPAEAQVSLAEMEAWNITSTVGALVISYPWLERNHPDPHGEQLRKISFVLKLFAAHARQHYPGCRVGVFWDYCSLPQKDFNGVDDRIEEEKATFKRALKGINAWYGHMKTHVLLVTTPLPEGHAYTNTQLYKGRGWCYAEMVMSGIVKDDMALIDMSKLKGDETTLGQLKQKGKAERQPPIAPDDFRATLRSGIKTGKIKFTNKGDIELVADIYERAFICEMSTATQLNFGALNWDDEQVTILSAALASAHARGGLKEVKELILSANKLGDKSCATLSEAFVKGALPNLESLDLRGDRIGNAGCATLAEALAKGALPQLKYLGLYGNPASEEAQKAVHPGGAASGTQPCVGARGLMVDVSGGAWHTC